MELTSRTSRNTIIVKGNLIPYRSPLSTKTYAWLLVSKLTAREIHHSHSIERSFFILLKVFSSLSHADSSFVGAGDVSQYLCTLQYVLWACPAQRPDATCIKARRLVKPWQMVTWHTHYIITLVQDCSRGLHSYVSARYIEHYDASTPTKIFGPIDTLCGNLHQEHC
jgi:hypothetical protein